MQLTPEWLPAALRWFAAVAAVTAVTGLVAPANWRRLHAVLPLATLSLALVVLRAAGRTSFTNATWQLTAASVWAGIAVVAPFATLIARPGVGGASRS